MDDLYLNRWSDGQVDVIRDWSNFASTTLTAKILKIKTRKGGISQRYVRAVKLSRFV